MRFTTKSGWWDDLGSAAAVCAIVAVLTTAVGVRAAEEAATNLDLMGRLTAEVVNELRGKFAPSVGARSVQLKPAGTTEDYVFVGNVFTTELNRAGFTTVEAPATAVPGDPDADGLLLEFQNVVFSVKYVDTSRSHLVGGKRVEREAGVRVLATLSEAASGKVVWVGEAAREATDEFDYSEATRVEAGTYVFTHPVMPSGGWGKYAEPVFVTGIIVGLIYLFFSNQSDN